MLCFTNDEGTYWRTVFARTAKRENGLRLLLRCRSVIPSLTESTGNRLISLSHLRKRFSRRFVKIGALRDAALASRSMMSRFRKASGSVGASSGMVLPSQQAKPKARRVQRTTLHSKSWARHKLGRVGDSDLQTHGQTAWVDAKSSVERDRKRIMFFILEEQGASPILELCRSKAKGAKTSEL